MRKIVSKFRRCQKRKFPLALINADEKVSLDVLARVMVEKKNKLSLSNTLVFVHSLRLCEARAYDVVHETLKHLRRTSLFEARIRDFFRKVIFVQNKVRDRVMANKNLKLKLETGSIMEIQNLITTLKSNMKHFAKAEEVLQRYLYA